ncbi:MAG: ImmA/IrrE family metallo-endopeptidase [Planctomycetes bacterium]|nr:ImmA/IrrE family metallo-endopeptidase [Planctomycetota bacterium]
MPRVTVKPELLRWAMKRSGKTAEELSARPKLKKLMEWERKDSDAKPTFKQLEDFANATYTPFGYFFLDEPPEEKLPIPDFRTVSGNDVSHPSPNLIDTIYAMQRRQDWLRDERIECEIEPLYFVGSAGLSDDPEAAGREMRRVVGISDGWATNVRTWEEAVSRLRSEIEELGVIAVINGVVENNTGRKLDVEEFRGFAMCDSHAPLIFVNGADAKSARMFTLAHELAHIWLGESALTDVGLISKATQKIEVWCDKAAAEFLVPARELEEYWWEIRNKESPFEAIARRFKVSPIVAGRRLVDTRLVDREVFFDFYHEYIKRENRGKKGSSGGDFYNNQNTRIGKLFATQVIHAAKDGRLSFKEAYDLTGLNGGSFQEYADRLGIYLP